MFSGAQSRSRNHARYSHKQLGRRVVGMYQVIIPHKLGKFQNMERVVDRCAEAYHPDCLFAQFLGEYGFFAVQYTDVYGVPQLCHRYRHLGDQVLSTANM